MQTTICHPYHFIPTVAERKATISGVAEPLNYQEHQFPLSVEVTIFCHILTTNLMTNFVKLYI